MGFAPAGFAPDGFAPEEPVPEELAPEEPALGELARDRSPPALPCTVGGAGCGAGDAVGRDWVDVRCVAEGDAAKDGAALPASEARLGSPGYSSGNGGSSSSGASASVNCVGAGPAVGWLSRGRSATWGSVTGPSGSVWSDSSDGRSSTAVADEPGIGTVDQLTADDDCDAPESAAGVPLVTRD